jgi:carboxypeptidase family protein
MTRRERRALSASVVASAVVLLFPTLVFAQVGALEGIVRDGNGSPQAGVAVEIAGPSLIEKVRKTTTDRDGKYKFSEVPIGMFTVEFRSRGFSTLLHTNIFLNTSRTASVDAHLTAGDMAEVVVVKHEEPTILINGKPIPARAGPRSASEVGAR